MKKRLILLGTVLIWFLFAASFFMPVTRDSNMVGWQAFWFYLAALWDVPEYWRQVAREPTAILASTFPSTNGAVFLAPLVIFRWPRWAGWLSAALTLGGLVPVFGFLDMIAKNELRVGFYCWVASIFAMALLCCLRWRGAKERGHQDDAAGTR